MGSGMNRPTNPGSAPDFRHRQAPWFSPARVSGEYHLAGHRVRFALTNAAATPAARRLENTWRAAARGTFFHFQQAGQRPTFVAVACPDAALGSAFARELICGGWFWPELRRHNLLFVVRMDTVRVLAGERPMPLPGLGAHATEYLLPRVRAQVEADTLERLACADRYARLVGMPFFAPELAGNPPDSVRGLVCLADRYLAVFGLPAEEARALAGALAEEQLWRPHEHGHACLRAHPEGFAMRLERADPAARRACERFAEDFCAHVVISDLHLGRRDCDTFGPHKIPALVALLEEVIWRRCTLVLNGDFLELLHERYGDIKRSYPEVFRLLSHVRRLVYVAGNHDEDILREHIKHTRRAVRARARRHAYAEVKLTASGGLRVEYQGDLALLRRHARAWRRVFEDPRLLPVMKEILRERGGRIWLTHGLGEEGVAFKRLGPRDTPQERPLWYFDEGVLHRVDPPARLLQLIADRRQRLDKVLARDWGHHVQTVRYWWDPERALYFEHGHFAMPECHGSSFGRRVSTLAGWLKRCGLRRIEHWVEDDLGGLLGALYPSGTVRETRRFLERFFAVAVLLQRLGEASRPPTILAGHTHQPTEPGTGPVHELLVRATGARYVNVGAWSNRHRRNTDGDLQSEWLEITAAGVPHLRRVTHPAPAGADRPAASVRNPGWLQRHPTPA